MIFRFGSVLFRDGGAADPSNGSNFASCNRDKNHAIAHTFIIRLMKTGIEAEKHRLASHYILRCLILPSYNVFNGTQQGVRRVTLRISGNSRSHEITLPVWDKETLQSRVPRKIRAAHERQSHCDNTLKKSPENERIIKSGASFDVLPVYALRHGPVR